MVESWDLLAAICTEGANRLGSVDTSATYRKCYAYLQWNSSKAHSRAELRGPACNERADTGDHAQPIPSIFLVIDGLVGAALGTGPRSHRPLIRRKRALDNKYIYP